MTLWYLNRATGVVCLVLFTAVMLLGVAVHLRTRLPGLPRFGTVTLHRSVSLIAVAFLGVHIVSAVADSYVSIGLTDVLVPFVGDYQPLWLGLGTVSLDLLIAVVATSLLRARLGHRAWRAVHWLAYASWPLAVVHGLGIGTDLADGWLLWLGIGCVAAVAAALVLRVVLPPRRPAPAGLLTQAPNGSAALKSSAARSRTIGV
jgi:predicted ferric reductase